MLNVSLILTKTFIMHYDLILQHNLSKHLQNPLLLSGLLICYVKCQRAFLDYTSTMYLYLQLIVGYVVTKPRELTKHN